jgi:cephalosporin hydroxylase
MKVKLTNGDFSQEVDLYSQEGLELVTQLWTKVSAEFRVMYEPTWLGIPIIQYPNDIVMIQELIWKVRPDVIIETGVAHGGSAILYASILELIGKGKVIAVDIEIRKYNEVAIKSHPLSKRITLIEGSSVDPDVVSDVTSRIRNEDTVLVLLDSNHSYEHVLKELELYSPLVSADSYLVAMDGAQEMVWDIPSGKKEWKDDNPLIAIREFLKKNPDWEVDPSYNRLLITSSPEGFLRRVEKE